MATVKCALGKRGRASHEWNDGEKDRIYCLGWVDPMTDDFCGDAVAWNICADIKAIPAADVAPVVRCKGCKHSWEDIGGLCCGYGPLVDSIVPEDFFCAYGKPKEG